MAAYKVVFVRHGESTWNRKNLFTGWADVPLTRKGVAEAKEAGKELKRKGFDFDVVFTNLHRRSLETVRVILAVLGLKIPVRKTWRLNERHYGALIGLNKAETAEKYGEKQVLLWRRSFDVRPPALSRSDKRYVQILKSYPDVPKRLVPVSESLADTYGRAVPFWEEKIVPAIKKGKSVLVVASHNSLRSLVKHIGKLSKRDIVEFTIPCGVPLVYEFDVSMRLKRHYYLGDAAQIRQTLSGMAAQGKAKK